MVLFLSPIITKQNISSSSTVHRYSAGALSRTFCRELSVALLLMRVDYSPFLFLIMWPFSGAVDRGKYVLIRPHVNPMKCFKNSGLVLMAFKKVDAVGDHIDWWRYIASSACELVCGALLKNSSHFGDQKT